MAPVDDLDEDTGAQPEEGQDEAEEEAKPDADGWLSLMDGKIRKKVLVEGTGENPEVKQDVRCTVVVRLAGSEPSEVLQRYENARYRIGEGDAPPMLELGLRHMKVGEEAELFGACNMAWGPTGLKAASDSEKPIPPNSDILMRVTLLENFPVKEGEGPPPWNEMIQEVTWRKTAGNDHFKRQDYQKALRCYGAGVELFSNNGFDPPEHIPEKDQPAAKAAAMSLVTDCGANLAAVHLELGNAVAAKEAATAVLEMCPEHVKGLYRMSRACLLLDEFDECEDAIKRGMKVDPGNAALQRVEVELRHKQKKYEAKSKKVAGRVFEGLDYPEEPPGKSKAADLAAKEPSWAQWAWEAFRDWFDWRIAVGILFAIVLLAAALTVLPKRHWPMTLIVFIMVVPMVVGIYTSSAGDAQAAGKDAKDKGKVAKKKD